MENNKFVKMFIEICKAIFKTKPTLMPNCPEVGQEWSAISTSGNLYSDYNNVRGWTWSPQNGLKEVQYHKCDGMESNADGSWEHAWGFNTSDINLEEAILLVEKQGLYSDCNGRDDEYYTLEAYRLSGLKEAIQEAEKKSWEEFESQVKEWMK